MQNIFPNNKEDIRTRILRNAMDYWGTANINDIDPMVKLLIEALSIELFNISNDVKNLENRVLSKVSRILASDYLASALPSHALIRAQPIENKETINIEDHFIYTRPAAKDNTKTSDLQVFFSPAGELTLYKADLLYTATSSHIYETDNAMHKISILASSSDSNTNPNTMWLGINCAPSLNTIQNLSLFFDWPEYSTNDDFYSLLSLVKCYYGDTELQAQSGLVYKEDEEPGNRPIFYEQNIINLVTQDIKDYYATRFLTLNGDALLDINKHKQAFPVEFAERFNMNDLSKLKPCLWLKLSFPAAIAASIIDDLQITLNCFPAINRHIHEDKLRPKDINNIIPIKTLPQEYFLDVKELYDDHDIYYSETPYTQATQRFEGSYTIRNGGAERFDPRDAQQLIEYLFELLRDEKAAFSSYGNDFLNAILKTLDQHLALIEKKFNRVDDAKNLSTYLIVKPSPRATTLFFQYWTTLADKANDIRRGSSLIQVGILKVQASSLRLMTSTVGGRNSLDSTERIQAYKYGLTSKGRIVTQADLTHFCHYELGNKISKVRIAKGIVISSNPKEGFLKTIDIYLQPAANLQLSDDEWDTLLTLLKSKLISRSIVNSNYRLFIDGR